MHYTLEGLDVQEYLKGLIAKIYKHPQIQVYHQATIMGVEGYVGNFVTTVKSEKGVSHIKHGAAVVAIGAEEYKPTEYLYGEDEKVMTQLELEEKIAADDEEVLSGRDPGHDPVRGLPQRGPQLLLAHLLRPGNQKQPEAEGKEPGGGHLRIVPRHAHLRLPGGRLPQSLQSGREIHPLRAGGGSPGQARPRRAARR